MRCDRWVLEVKSNSFFVEGPITSGNLDTDCSLYRGRFVDSMPGVRCGHAATIVEGDRGTAKGKIEGLKRAGIMVAESFSDIVPILKEYL